MIFRRTISRDDLFPCALCENAPCTKACGLMDCAALLRSAWFDNEQGAARALPRLLPCAKCSAKCEKACVFSGKVRIRKTMEQLAELREELELKEKPDRGNLQAGFAGFSLRNPFILDEPEASDTLEKCLNAFGAGFGGVILPAETREEAAAAGYVSPRFGSLKAGGSVIGLIDIGAAAADAGREPKDGAGETGAPENAAAEGIRLPGCLAFVPELKRSFPERMVIATYRNGQETEPAGFSALAEKAGADAVLLDFDSDMQPAVRQTRQIRTCLESVREKTALPLILRFQASDVDLTELLAIAGEYGVSALNPEFSSSGIFSVNRHYYAPEPSVRGKSSIGRSSGLSIKPTALARQAFLAKHNRSEKLQFLSGTGVETWGDGLDFILLGATAVCVSDAVMCYGLRVIDDLTDGLSSYLAEKNFGSIGELTGVAVADLMSAEELDKGTVMYPSISRTKCIRCGRCTLACTECATGAITEDFDHAPMLIAKRCTGCHLCIQVCPAGAIAPGKRR